MELMTSGDTLFTIASIDAAQTHPLRATVPPNGDPNVCELPVNTRPPGRLRRAQASCALSSTARNSTSAPAAAHSGVIASASLWLSPSTHGTKIIPVGATRAT